MKQTDTKRTRRDRGELEDIMFKLFERQPNWALKQLVQETDQPAVCLSAHLFSCSFLFSFFFRGVGFAWRVMCCFTNLS